MHTSSVHSTPSSSQGVPIADRRVRAIAVRLTDVVRALAAVGAIRVIHTPEIKAQVVDRSGTVEVE